MHLAHNSGVVQRNNRKNKEKEKPQLPMSSGLVRVLRQARENKKLTQTALAAKVGLNQSSIAKIETGWDPLESTCRHASLSIL